MTFVVPMLTFTTGRAIPVPRLPQAEHVSMRANYREPTLSSQEGWREAERLPACPSAPRIHDALKEERSLRPMPLPQVGQNPCLRSRRGSRLLRELVPAAAQLSEPAPFDWLEQVELDTCQTVQQSSDSRGNTQGHGHLPRNGSAI